MRYEDRSPSFRSGWTPDGDWGVITLVDKIVQKLIRLVEGVMVMVATVMMISTVIVAVLAVGIHLRGEELREAAAMERAILRKREEVSSFPG